MMTIKNIKTEKLYEAELKFTKPNLVLGILYSEDRTEFISVIGKIEGKILKLYNDDGEISYWKMEAK